jgi:hypothetical protein
MFAFLRKLWDQGLIPPVPPETDLDFPNEEQWVWDEDNWRWVAEELPFEDNAWDEEY